MRFRYLLIGLAALGLVSLPLLAQKLENVPQAQQQPPTQAPPTVPGLKVGVINLQEAVWRTKEGQKATEDMQAQFGPRNAELQKLVQEIQEIENQLRMQERTLSEDARAQLARQADQKRRMGTRLQEDFQTDSQTAQNDHIARILGKMQKVIDQFARERGFGIVINSTNQGPVIYAAPAVEITDDVIRLYDQVYPVAAAPAQKPPAKPATPQPPPAQPPKPPQPQLPR